jgi:hypothetical protein
MRKGEGKDRKMMMNKMNDMVRDKMFNVHNNENSLNIYAEL